jgi:hypothetical protein
MSTWVKVARFNLERPTNYLLLPWIIPLSFAVGAVTEGRRPPHVASGYLVSFFLFFAVHGAQTVGQSLPFGLTLGASRRSFYFGTALLGMALALVSGLVLTALQAIERATGGWGRSARWRSSRCRRSWRWPWSSSAASSTGTSGPLPAAPSPA